MIFLFALSDKKLIKFYIIIFINFLYNNNLKIFTNLGSLIKQYY